MHFIIPRNYVRDISADYYAMILQNMASREVFLFQPLPNLSASTLHYDFEVDIPATAQAGEYTYYVVPVETPSTQFDLSRGSYQIQAVRFDNAGEVMQNYDVMSANDIGATYQLYGKKGNLNLWKFVQAGNEYEYHIESVAHAGYQLATSAKSTKLALIDPQTQTPSIFTVSESPHAGYYRIAFENQTQTHYIGYNQSSPRYAMYLPNQSGLYIDLRLMGEDPTTRKETTFITDTQPLLSKVMQPDGTTVLLRDLKPEIGLIMYKTTNADANIYPETQAAFIYYDEQKR